MTPIQIDDNGSYASQLHYLQHIRTFLGLLTGRYSIPCNGFVNSTTSLHLGEDFLVLEELILLQVMFLNE